MLSSVIGLWFDRVRNIAGLEKKRNLLLESVLTIFKGEVNHGANMMNYGGIKIKEELNGCKLNWVKVLNNLLFLDMYMTFG